MVPQLQWVGWFFPVTDREEQYSKVSPRINPFEALFAGFIDFIVAPTLAVCGDVISLVVGETADQDQVYKPFLALDLSSISDIKNMYIGMNDKNFIYIGINAQNFRNVACR